MSRIHSPIDSWRPNGAQEKIINHGSSRHKDRPLVVFAGAGTGKTRTLSLFLGNLLRSSVLPSRILIISFSNNAVDRARACNKKAIDANLKPEAVQCVTLHALALRFICAHTTKLGLMDDFTILPPDDCEKLMAAGLPAQLKKRLDDGARALAIYSFRTNARLKLGKSLRKRYPDLIGLRKELTRAFAAYDKAKRALNVVDFDDLLTFWLILLRDETIRQQHDAAFDHILIDEVQDFSQLQLDILRTLRPSGKQVVAFGDAAQAINSYRGAPTDIMRQVRNGFSVSARRLYLSQNYRSTESILSAANIITANSKRRVEPLWTKNKAGKPPRLVRVANEVAAAKFVVDDIEARKNDGRHRTTAILARTSSELKLIKSKLDAAGIRYGSHKRQTYPVEAFVVDVLRWCENPRDRYSARRVIAVAGFEPTDDNVERLTASLITASEPYKGSSKVLAEFSRFLRAVCHAEWTDQIPLIFKWLAETERSIPPAARNEERRIKARARDVGNRLEYIRAASLNAHEGVKWTDERVVVSTIHAAKGGEWDSVFILNALDGAIPSSRASATSSVEEERNVLHVGMTRARRRLTLLLPKRCKSVSGAQIQTARTRFITTEMLCAFKRSKD